MCGIFGLLEISLKLPNEEIGRYSRIGFHHNRNRGPDGQGEYCGETENKTILLQHSRLSIIDTSEHGHQPMHDPFSEWVITYNGEIYNYIEIRSELAALGWSFHGQSDTEVLLKAWSQWGMDALQKLNGMFAFAVHSKRTGDTILVRDRFGVKPLCWGKTKFGGIVFSSSGTAVAECIGASVNFEYCASGLKYKTYETSDDKTAFLEVFSLPPGHWMKISSKSTEATASIGCWYDLKTAVRQKSASLTSRTDTDILEECEFLLKDAVCLRLRSDVPLAISLSGGMDSSAIAAIAATKVSNLTGFTYGSPAAPQSEGPVVSKLTNELGVRPEYIWPDLDKRGLEDLFDSTLSYQEEPFPTLSILAQNQVYRDVRQAGFKVLLGGQGGDEIFAGYRKFFIVSLRHAINSGETLEAVRLLYSLGLMLLNEVSQATYYIQALHRYRANGQSGFRLMNWEVPTLNLWGASGISLTDRQIQDVDYWSLPTLLRYEDRNSMGNSVESRLPFMDYRLVELALALPSRLKIVNGYGKWALRKVTQDIVPDYIRLARKKRGFDVTQSWIKDGLGTIIRERILDNQASLRGFLKADINLTKEMEDETLDRDHNLLDEALTLAWLIHPQQSYFSQRA